MGDKMPPPKHRISRFWARRRHLMFYMDHYRWIWRGNFEKQERARYQKPMVEQDYLSPPFKYGGFWPVSFGHHRTWELAKAFKEVNKEEAPSPTGRPPGPADSSGPRS